MARAAKKETPLTTEEKLAKALVPEEEQPYPVPEDWCWMRFHDLCSEIQYGYTAKSIKDDTLPKMLRITDVQDGLVNWNDVPNCQISENEFKKYQLAEGDIVFARTGATTGKSYLITHPPDSVYASYLIRVRLSSFINRKYSYYFLQTSYYWNYITEVSAGIAQPGCNAKKLGKLPFPLPPLPEQQRIVTLIESLFADLDAAKDKLQAVLDGFAKRRAALLHRAFTGELTREWREEQGVDLESWKEITLGFVCQNITYGYTAKAIYNNAFPKMLRITDIQENGVNWEKVPNCEIDSEAFSQYELRTGDIVFARTGATTGKSYLIENPPCAVYASYLIRIRLTNDAYTRYVYHFLQSTRYWEQISDMSAGIAQPGVNAKKLKGLCFPLATLPEQKEIVRILDDIFAKEFQAKAAVESALAKIDTMKKAILATAFRGGFDTNESSDESAKDALRRML